MPSTQQLRYLVALADTLHFTRAAEISHVTQPTLSLQLKELEARLGTQLVERNRSRVLLTPVGQEVARRARTILAELEDIREIARREDPQALQGSLHLGVVQTVGAYVLSLAMPDLRAHFPHLRFIVREGRQGSLPEHLLDGQHDMLLLPEDPDMPEITAFPLIREPLHLVMPTEHPLAALDLVPPEALRGETILTMASSLRAKDPIARLCRKVGAHHATDYAGTTLDTLRQMVAVGMGLTLLPALYVRSDVLREKLVVARPLAHSVPSRQITLCWRQSAPRHATYQKVAAVMRDCLLPWGLD